MPRRLRSVGLDFVESAALRLVFDAEVSAPPEAVYRALADDVAGWPSWFTSVTTARPIEEGAGREVRLRGGAVLRESILAAEPGERYAYRVDESNAPGPKALVEEWRLTPAGTGTRVRWTFAADGSAPFRFTLRLARPGMGRAFRNAVRNLDRRLAAPAA
ncbi:MULTISPECIES: SRPBCC family protein [unclassified Streptomyces]|uniref:SRPBCC family protein n=1 Tax=unclassified Streptomyces TaxID=2593676 RepID=UPI00225869CE|nr:MULTISPECIES: SRPBCC family protein [unclassified Streptomyces]WSP53650.1 SRPBCC family protein [Streptomyces sp. NBC_01241]WSU25684.1 SRPBCC family protein [Streptomyces sp. NBC_01108]MCX4785044.1 SRPBCC family protein [Streptomyces sp. NBC_01221]MCX4799016.1 SRPBCC family protein [Streptomyces sp. NBC_01242]WSP66513.1 SRPBCC family protein [Streptomyces sp. NBC_01240]